jgi:hypothetical protein
LSRGIGFIPQEHLKSEEKRPAKVGDILRVYIRAKYGKLLIIRVGTARTTGRVASDVWISPVQRTLMPGLIGADFFDGFGKDGPRHF